MKRKNNKLQQAVQSVVERAGVIGVVFALSFLSPTAHAERIPRIELLHAVEVAGTQISLSDLLPVSAPEDLRARAAGISLGSSPQPGNTRVLDATAIARSTGADADVLGQVVVPARMIVSRGARPITLEEVFTAIRVALRESGVRAAETLRPEDILFQSQVFVAAGDSGLEVMRMDVDQALSRARFLLWPSHDPSVVPFLVTVRLAGDLNALPLRRTAGASGLILQRSASRIAEATKQEILVARGERATLVLRSDSLRMFLDVVSLQGGVLGQRIQVRTLDGGKVFNAQVDGKAHLEVAF